jgi:glycine/D-amino acid oxidase-like deaminating enzyme
MTRYGRSPWIDTFPKSRLPAHPRHRGHLDAEIIIVGGGLTGCATAYAFSAAGVRVALLEAKQIAHASSGSAAGWISDDPGVGFGDVEKELGLRAARRAWQAWRRAALDFAALIRRLNLKCQFEPHPSLLVAATAEQAARLRREQKVRKEAGLEAPLINGRAVAAEAGLEAIAAIRSRDTATLDPYRLAIGLAAAAAERGARLFERSPVERVTFTRKWVDVKTDAGTLRGQRVVIATGVPTPLYKALVRHVWFRSSYLALTAPIPAKVRQQLGRREAVIRDSATPPHLARWVGEDRLLVMGADADTPPERLADKTIVQRTGQLMYELSTMYPEMSGVPPAYGWEAHYARTAEGIPLIGPHRNFPRHLFAFGDASHSVTGAYLASRILLRHYLEDVEPADDVFGFGGRL